VAAGDGRLWLATSGLTPHDILFRIDPATNSVARTMQLGPNADGIAVGAGAVWVSYQTGRLSRIEFDGSKVSATYSVGSAASGVAVAGGDVWVSNGLNGVVYRFDPRKKKVVQTVTLPGGADAIAAGENGVWVADKTAGAVVRVDPSTGAAGS